MTGVQTCALPICLSILLHSDGHRATYKYLFRSFCRIPDLLRSWDRGWLQLNRSHVTASTNSVLIMVTVLGIRQKQLIVLLDIFAATKTHVSLRVTVFRTKDSLYPLTNSSFVTLPFRFLSHASRIFLAKVFAVCASQALPTSSPVAVMI